MDKNHLTLEYDKILDLLCTHCACEDARSMVYDTPLEPNLNLARAALAQTADAHMLLGRFGGPPFGGLLNVTNALRRAEAGGGLSPRELLLIAQVLRVLRGISRWREGNAGVESNLDALFGGIQPNNYLEEQITRAILAEDQISDNASSALYDIRRSIRRRESDVRSKLEQMSRSAHYGKALQENLVTMRGGRYVLPVKAEHKSEIPGLIHDASSSGATVFIEPMAVVEMNNDIKELRAKEREEIEKILAALSQEAGSFADQIAASYECAVELDVIFAKAKLGYDMKASVPQLNNLGQIALKAARHPLISRDKVVPIDVELGTEFDALVVTGPNTGGKTVTLKTLGLLALMAMGGLLLPCAERSQMSVFHHVLADIGDEQSISQSLSTFSSHMTNIVSIIDTADSQSLVLIDELGAGTDPVEGAALAMAILEAVRGKGAKLATTTHYAELKEYALQTAGVVNACCEFDVDTLRPTYKLLIGVPGRSNAFAIAERLGLSAAVVDRARTMVKDTNIEFERIVAKLQEQRSETEKLKSEALQALAEAQAVKQNAEKEKQRAQKEMEVAIGEARAQGQRLLEQTKREAYAFLGELEGLKKERETVSNVEELARRARAMVKRGLLEVQDAAEATGTVGQTAASDAPYELPRPVEVGDTVLLADMGITGEVLSPLNDQGKVEVKAGILRTWTPIANIRLTETKAKDTAPTGPAKTRKRAEYFEQKLATAADDGSTRLDVRGTNSEDCEMQLDQFLDKAMRMGIREFTVVHGKGTGVLRKTVANYLRRSPSVNSFRLGKYGEGEDGVTIVALK
jgi:DNA mismatch repair protein MutS2